MGIDQAQLERERNDELNLLIVILETAGLADAELRDHLVKNAAAFSSELARTSERITSELQRITTQLQSEKLDSAAIAAGLTDLAAKLTGGQTSGKKSPRA